MNWKWTSLIFAVLAIALGLALILRPPETNRVVVKDTVPRYDTVTQTDTVAPDLDELRGSINNLDMVLPDSHHPAYDRALERVRNNLPGGS